MQTIKLNITQLNTLVKRIIDAEEFLQVISVYGEVSNFKISANNAYFDIKEDGAQLSCIMFGANNLNIKSGDMVLLTGRLNYYVKTGKLSFIANYAEPYGIGELYKQYILLKQKLEAQGLFDERYKKQLPKYTKTVGVVTSETGAVIRDIVHVAKKKNPNTDIIIYPARVQGVNAEDEIIAGLNYFESTNVDVVIVARGGGSFEDLAPFNTEKLARRIFEFSKPIISAVGHETDFSLSDFVADMRAPTPSVAAELAFYNYDIALSDLSNCIYSIYKQADTIIGRIQTNLFASISKMTNRVEVIKKTKALRLSNVTDSILSLQNKILQQKKNQIEQVTGIIDKLNPLQILKKGYSIAYKNDSKIISGSQVDIGDTIRIKVTDTVLVSKVTGKE